MSPDAEHSINQLLEFHATNAETLHKWKSLYNKHWKTIILHAEMIAEAEYFIKKSKEEEKDK